MTLPKAQIYTQLPGHNPEICTFDGEGVHSYVQHDGAVVPTMTFTVDALRRVLDSMKPDTQVHIPLQYAAVAGQVVLTATERPQWDGKLVYYDGKMVIDMPARLWILNGEDVQLPPLEFSLLEVLTERAGEVVGYDDIIDSIWPLGEAEGVEDEMPANPRRAINVYAFRLRRALDRGGFRANSILVTHVNVGYRFKINESNPLSLTQAV